MPYTVEVIRQVWDDDLGTRVEVGPDADGLDLVEIREVGSNGDITARITMTKEMAWAITNQLRITLTEAGCAS